MVIWSVLMTTTVLVGGNSGLPIVYGKSARDERAARYLQSCVKDTTGVELRLVRQAEVGGTEKAVFLVSGDTATNESFRVVVKDGSVRFSGAAYHAAYDFCERVLGVRQYWPTKDGGRSVVPRKSIEIQDMDYSDAPFFKRRESYPYDATEWGASWRPGDSHAKAHFTHAPQKWWIDTNYNYRVTRPEIFQRTRDGQRVCNPMLCYGNPKTLETYKERIVEEIEHGVSSGGLVNMRTKCITVSQWDAPVDCTCEYCSKLRDPAMGNTGDASPILWGYFTKELSEWLHERYPDWVIVILPYKNTCDVPKGLVFPHGNVEALLCTMPGLALLKQPLVKKYEEDLIRAWVKATGRKVQNWHYSCWPAEFTSAPFVYGETIRRHYQDCRDLIAGSFINGPFEVNRLSLSCYVWMKVLWNPDVDVQKIYDEFAERMFGKGSRPMRELVRMQEDGWNRVWNVPQTSNKNIYGISYPRQDVLKMQALFAEARKLAAGDELSLKRIAYYESGFAQFFRESEEYASGCAFATTMMMKAGTMPTIDGALDEGDWARAAKYEFVPAKDRTLKAAKDPTELRVLWVPEKGVIYGIRGFCADMAHVRRDRPLESFLNENVEIYFDPSGNGEGAFGQLILNVNNDLISFNEKGRWDPQGVRTGVRLYDDRWEMEVFIPFSVARSFAKAQIPAGAGGDGLFWNGNLVRMHYSTVKGVSEMTRLYTRYNQWNCDLSAFGKFQFVE